MKKTLLFAATAFTAIACNTAPSNTLTVNGTVVDTTLNSQTVYLTDYSTNQKIDSVIITDGKFTFTRNTDSLSILRVSVGRTSANVIVENGIVDVKLDHPSTVSGAPLNNTMATYTSEVDSITKGLMDTYKEMTAAAATESAVDSLMQVAEQVMTDINNRYYSANKTNNLGLFVAWNKLQGDLTLAQIDEVIAEVGVKAQNFEPIQKIRLTKVNEELTAEGKMFVDFPGTSPEGAAIKLSDFVGKGNYVLADFWGSWCGPCKAAMPSIKELYNKYKSKGLVVLGVNVWDEKEGFEKAVVELELPWAQICNFDNKVPTELYGIMGIPQIILFAPDGTIVKRDLHGDQMKEAVEAAYATKK